MSSTKRDLRSLLGQGLAFSVLLFYTFLALLPLYLMIVSSLIPLGVTFDVNDLQLYPRNPSLNNLFAFNHRVSGYLGRWLINSAIVSTLPVATNILFGVMAGYALGKMRFPGSRFLFWLMIATMTIPQFVILIPLYELVWQFNWKDTYTALIVPFMAGIATVFLSRQFVQTLPGELLESATMDGCGEWGLFWHIILPLSRPLLGVLAIMGFVGAWLEYFWTYLVIDSRAMYTVQMGILGVLGVDGGYAGELDYGEIMAASLVASIPVICVFFAAQRHFVKGITFGGIKG